MTFVMILGSFEYKTIIIWSDYPCKGCNHLSTAGSIYLVIVFSNITIIIQNFILFVIKKYTKFLKTDLKNFHKFNATIKHPNKSLGC